MRRSAPARPEPDRKPGPTVPAAVPAPLSLQRKLGNRATARLLQRRGPKPPPPPAAPRPDFVFIMGADKPGRRGRPSPNPFFEVALQYWKAHLPTATFVTDKRDLDGVLTFLAAGTSPIGHIYIVTHANEDGTLSFGLDSLDRDKRLSVPELREALHPASGKSLLSNVSKRVDAQTRIHIKGCDIGRTQPMIELIDEAFGGAGKVDAPTHEQEYGTDPTLAARARKEFRAEIEAAHPMPEKLDPTLKGTAKAAAKAERDKAVRQRNADVAAEVKARAAEADKRATLAGHYEALSGPLFQRPGTKRFTAAELRKEVDRLYPHLSEKRRAALAAGLAAPDKGTPLDQRGQKLVTRDAAKFTFMDPRTMGEALALFGKDFRRDRFSPTTFKTTRVPVTGGFQVRLDFEQKARDGTSMGTQTITGDPTPGDAELLKQGKSVIPNPDRYAWRIEERHKGGQTTRVAVAERVLAYLHHESLDASKHDHFTRPLTDKEFYATSTFGDPPPPGAAKGRPATKAPVPAVKRKALQRRTLQRQPAQRPASGIKTSGPMGAYVQAAAAYVREPKNAGKRLSEFALFLHGEANRALASLGVPATKPDWDTSAGFIGEFDANDWKITMNPARFSKRAAATAVGLLTADEQAVAVSMIYHEARHAEQHFRIARVAAARLKPGATPPLTLKLKTHVLDAVHKQHLLPTDAANKALIAEADEWAQGIGGLHAQYGGVVSEWSKEAAVADNISVSEPMRSHLTRDQWKPFIARWRGDTRSGFLKKHLRAVRAVKKPTPVDTAVASQLKQVIKSWDQLDAAWKTVEATFDRAGLHARLKLLTDLEPLANKLAIDLNTAYRSHVQEADAFATGDEVGRLFAAALTPPVKQPTPQPVAP